MQVWLCIYLPCVFFMCCCKSFGSTLFATYDSAKFQFHVISRLEQMNQWKFLLPLSDTRNFYQLLSNSFICFFFFQVVQVKVYLNVSQVKLYQETCQTWLFRMHRKPKKTARDGWLRSAGKLQRVRKGNESLSEAAASFGTFLQPAEDHHCFLARAIWDMLLTVAIPKQTMTRN